MRFSIGEIVVDVVVDDDAFELPLTSSCRGRPAGPERHRGLLEPDFLDLARDALKCAIQTFILRLAGRTILIDTARRDKDRPEIPAWNQRSGSAFRPAARRRPRPAAVDTVFCTHLHIDHVGWNRQRADGRWAPTFPTRAIWLAAPSRPTGWPARRGHRAGDARPRLGGQRPACRGRGLGGLGRRGSRAGPGLVLTPLPGHTTARWGYGSTASTAAPSSVATRCTARCNLPAGHLDLVLPLPKAPPRLGGSCSTKPQRPAGWWCQSTFAAGAGRMYATPAPVSPRSSRMRRDKVVAARPD